MSILSRIKILFVHSTLVCGGAEQALFDLVTLINKEKFDVTILVQHEGGIWEEKFRNAGIRVVTIWGNQKVSNNPFIKLQNYFQRCSIQKALNCNGTGLVDASLKEKFDIIVSYCVWDHHRVGFQKGAKTIKYIHGDVATLSDYKQSIIETSSILKDFDHIICVSENARKSFTKLTKIHQNVSAHFNPINSTTVCSLANQNINFHFSPPTICAVGRLAVEKGFDRLIRIHKHILSSGIPHTLVIVGDGPERENLEHTITELQVTDSVSLVGYQENPYPYMLNSAFLVCSSFSEGLPVIAMESLCLGIPIVSAVPSIGELFATESCGIITKNDDQSLENGIRRMLTDTAFYSKQKEGAQKRSTFFDGRTMAKEIEDIFSSLIDKN